MGGTIACRRHQLHDNVGHAEQCRFEQRHLHNAGGTLADDAPAYTISRVVLIDATGKISQTRIITGVASPTVSWSTNDPLTGTFTPVAARVETQELRYTWLFTVMPSSGGGTSNVEVTVFFHRPLVATDEQVYQATGVDGVQTPFTISYSGTKPFIKKGSFLFDAYFGRWYRILNVTNDTGSTVQVFRGPVPADGRLC